MIMIELEPKLRTFVLALALGSTSLQCPICSTPFGRLVKLTGLTILEIFNENGFTQIFLFKSINELLLIIRIKRRAVAVL